MGAVLLDEGGAREVILFEERVYEDFVIDWVWFGYMYNGFPLHALCDIKQHHTTSEVSLQVCIINFT